MADGRFILIIPADDLNKKIMVSYVGYSNLQPFIKNEMAWSFSSGGINLNCKTEAIPDNVLFL
jgi:hypothetical protein